MREHFEYHSIHFPGFSDEELENIDSDLINRLLKDRVRQYNRLGSEGWSLISEHLDSQSYSAIATFRRRNESVATTTDTSESQPQDQPLSSSPSYPTLQPTSGSPDAYRLVWEK